MKIEHHAHLPLLPPSSLSLSLSNLNNVLASYVNASC